MAKSVALACALVFTVASDLRAQPRLFEFHSAFWLNLHHYLHALARNLGALHEPLPTAASPQERDTWTATMAAYRQRYSRRSLLFDAELVASKLQLAAAESRESLGDAKIPEAQRAALDAAAPIYRRYRWAAHDAANRRTIAAAEDLLKRHGSPIATRLAASYGAAWPAQPIRVDLVHDAGPPGNAYTTNDPTHVTIAAADPRHQGNHLLELMFHEASHGWDSTLMNEVSAAARQQNVRADRDLWHALLFFNAGTIAAEALSDAGIRDYQMYADTQKLFGGRWVSWRPVIAKHWQAFLSGDISRPEAIARIAREIP